MKKSIFLQKLQEALEVDDIELTEETNLQKLEDFDSLAIMNIIALVDSHFNVILPDFELEKITTVKSLMKLIGIEKFE